MKEKLGKTLFQKWATLRKVNDTKFVKSMYVWIFFVPITAKSLEFLGPDVLNFVVFQEEFPINPKLPFSWVVFYFSALFFAIGNIILLVKCPRIVKDHLSYSSYESEGKTLKQLDQYSDDIGYDWGKLASKVNKDITRLQMMKEEGNGGMQHDARNLSVENPIHYFWPIFEEADSKYSFSRFLCTLSYALGFVLFVVVAIQNAWVVIEFVNK